MEEEWRDIPEYEGIYQASNLGRISSMDRVIKKGENYAKIKYRVLSQGTTTGGYKKVNLSNLGKCKMFDVHVLVAKAFLDHIQLSRKIVIDHIDGDKTNNCIENLRVVTSRFNSSTPLRISKLKKKSDIVGAHFCSKTSAWTSSIRYNNKTFYLGSFKSDTAAGLAYNRALRFIETGGFYEYIDSIRRKNSSSVKGVSFNKKLKRWLAYYRIYKKCITIGRYKTECEAIVAINNHINKAA